MYLCRFQFAHYCCEWLQIFFISGLDCFFDYTRLCVTSAWFYPQSKCSLLLFDTSNNISTANRNSYPLLKKLAPVNDIWYFLPEHGKNFRSRVTTLAPTKARSNSTSRRGARASYRMMLPEFWSQVSYTCRQEGSERNVSP